MKKPLIKISLICFIIALPACEGVDQNRKTTDVGHEVKEELIQLQLQIAKMDSLKNEIDSASKRVDEALEEL